MAGARALGDSTVCEQKRRFCMTVIGAVLAALAVAGGCQDQSARQASQTLRDEIDKAQRLSSKALTLLKNAVVVDRSAMPEREIVPSAKAPSDKLDIKVLPARGHVSEEAQTSLKRAIKILEAALAARGEARDPDVVLAYRQLARVHSLVAHCHRVMGGHAVHRVEENVRQVEEIGIALRARGALVRHYDLLVAARNEEAEKSARDAKAEGLSLQTRLKDTEKKIADLLVEKKAQTRRMNEAATKSRELRGQSKSPSCKDPMAVLEQALEKQSQANEAVAAITRIENQVDVLNSERGELSLKLELSEAIQKSMREILQAGDARIETSKQERGEEKARLAAEIKAMAEPAGEIDRWCKEAQTQEDLAKEALAKAIEARAKAVKILAKTAGPETFAQQGDDRMARGELGAERLRLRLRISNFGEAMKDVWQGLPDAGPIPGRLGSIAKTYLDDPAAVQKEAQEQYDLAVRDFGEALDRLKAQAREDRTASHREWAYLGQQATAYLGLYRLTKDAGAREQARELLEEALKGKASSPYLKSLVWLRSQLDS